MRYLGLGVGHVDSSLRAPPCIVNADHAGINPLEDTEDFEIDETEDENPNANDDVHNSDEDVLNDSGGEDEIEEEEDFLDIDDSPHARL